MEKYSVASTTEAQRCTVCSQSNQIKYLFCYILNDPKPNVLCDNECFFPFLKKLPICHFFSQSLQPVCNDWYSLVYEWYTWEDIWRGKWILLKFYSENELHLQVRSITLAVICQDRIMFSLFFREKYSHTSSMFFLTCRWLFRRK